VCGFPPAFHVVVIQAAAKFPIFADTRPEQSGRVFLYKSYFCVRRRRNLLETGALILLLQDFLFIAVHT
jgi:hypothetical protein